MAKASLTFKGLATLQTIATDLESDLNEELRRVSQNLVNSLAVETPKKTGLATGNWQVGINNPVTSTTSRVDLTGATVATEESRVIDTAKNYKFPEIWVSNNLDYVEDLNQGSSEQAPAKFIEKAINKAQRAG